MSTVACGLINSDSSEKEEVMSVEMEDGSAFMEEEQVENDIKDGYVSNIFDIDGQSFYFRSSGWNPNIGKIDKNNILDWRIFESSNAAVVIKSEDKQLNNALLTAHYRTVNGNEEWLVRIYKYKFGPEYERTFTPPFTNARIEAIYQLGNTPKQILNEYKKAGIDVGDIKADYEIFCILGAINRNTPFFYFFAVRQNDSFFPIVSLPSFIKADTTKITSPAQKFFFFENIATVSRASDLSTTPGACGTAQKINSNFTQLFLSGRGNSSSNGKPLLGRVSIKLDADFNFNNDNCKILIATFNYDVNLDWLTELSIGGDASFQSSVDRVIVVDTIGSQYNIYATGYAFSFNNAWIAALDSDGKLKWQKEYYGVKGKIRFHSLLLDGNQLIVGGNTGFEVNKKNDFTQFGYIGLLDKANGSIISQKRYGIPGQYTIISAIRKQDEYIRAWGVREPASSRPNTGWSFKIKKSNL